MKQRTPRKIKKNLKACISKKRDEWAKKWIYYGYIVLNKPKTK